MNILNRIHWRAKRILWWLKIRLQKVRLKTWDDYLEYKGPFETVHDLNGALATGKPVFNRAFLLHYDVELPPRTIVESCMFRSSGGSLNIQGPALIRGCTFESNSEFYELEKEGMKP